MPGATQPANWYNDPTGRHQYRYWNGTEWTDQVADNQVTSTDPPLMPESTAAPTAWPKPAPTPRRRAGRVFSALAAAGGLVLVVGSFLPAFTLVDEHFSYVSDGRDGQILLPVGVAIIVLAIVLAVGVLPRWGAFLVVGAGGIAALVAIADVIDVQDTVDESQGLITAGPATWVCAAGGLIAVVFALLAYFKPESPVES